MAPSDVSLLEARATGVVGAGPSVDEHDDWVDSGVPGVLARCRRRVAREIDTGVPGTACA
ncbi:hypothetical protein [Cellulomonas bogoriensis]|uniref:Uncharacterized protein n=1 Tax=Cellulomonas bogoriensis 69B4 = DSM 16987 TaxID=1386082 RepID=A0A0A0BP55_9CELL|nr:hypothetical protein [Cellulomonas bogoriensis]KGM08879.1 hypothetical protein N869_03345 [Cellulomonas bogoriensis 69B4 = DSM 16987]